MVSFIPLYFTEKKVESGVVIAELFHKAGCAKGTEMYLSGLKRVDGRRWKRGMLMTTVLIVDDDADIRRTLRDLLADEGHVTREARDGVVALDCLRQSAHPLVALVDLSMPRLDGMGLLQQVQSDPHLATTHAYIVMSAKGRTLPLALVQQMQHMHIQYLGKPFDIDDLLAAVDKATHHVSK